jgi:hypothetical protein
VRAAEGMRQAALRLAMLGQAAARDISRPYGTPMMMGNSFPALTRRAIFNASLRDDSFTGVTERGPTRTGRLTPLPR